MHILSVKQFSREFLDAMCQQADMFEVRLGSSSARNLLSQQFQGKKAYLIFDGESWRTRFSFIDAARFLGMHPDESQNVSQFSSRYPKDYDHRGESLEDSIKVLRDSFKTHFANFLR